MLELEFLADIFGFWSFLSGIRTLVITWYTAATIR